MNAQDPQTQPENEGGPLRSVGEGLRKPYAPPRLRSLGRVNDITLAPASTGDEFSRKKPQG
jgi:hypothetical protein